MRSLNLPRISLSGVSVGAQHRPDVYCPPQTLSGPVQGVPLTDLPALPSLSPLAPSTYILGTTWQFSQLPFPKKSHNS
jgi:hypothetical protein